VKWRTIFASLKSRDMQKRLLVVLGLIVAYRLLAHIPVPLAEPAALKQVIDSVISSSNFGGFLNLLSGGALASFSIVLVGLGPYITASIIMQLLTKVIPRMEELHKDGESGRRKINQWTRVAALPLAVVQSIAFIFILRQTVLAGNTAILNDTSPIEWLIAVTAMTAGSMLLMWLGELITEQGIGNGISLLIFAGIISQLPQMATTLGTSIFTVKDASEALHVFNWFTLPVNGVATLVSLAILIVSLIVLYILVKINEAQRIININYAKRVQGNSAYGGVKSLMPIKLITAGVIPVIFAVAFLSLPAFLGQVIKATGNPDLATLGSNLVTWFQTPQPGAFTGFLATDFIYPISYFVLVVLFTYFYTGIVFNSNEIAENLQKQGGFIENIRPGASTEKYLRTVVNRLTLFGALALGLIAIMPFIGEFIFARLNITVGTSLAIGGTGLLIVVSVALEALRQINSRALMVTYDEYK
jgi:preprotein translocase subunit SecY